MQDTLYYPWGQVWALGSGWADERFSQGQELETFFYPWLKPTNARKYNPNLGRWLSPDPLAGDVTNPQSLNRYAYVLNNPTNFVDPSGMGLCDRNPDGPSCNHDPHFNDAVSRFTGPSIFSFGMDEFDLAAMGLISLGPNSAALP